MNAIVANLPPDTGLAALANESAQAWNRAYELEDKRREGEWAKYFAAGRRSRSGRRGARARGGREPDRGPDQIRCRDEQASEHGGRLAARRSADRAGLVASLERDKAAMTVTYLPTIAYD
jgi:hypothetical protein